MSDIKIYPYVPPIDDAHQHVMWYGGDVCRFTSGKNTVVLAASGPVSCTLLKAVPAGGPPTQEYIMDFDGTGKLYGAVKNDIQDDACLAACSNVNSAYDQDDDAIPDGYPVSLKVHLRNYWTARICAGDAPALEVRLHTDLYQSAVNEIIHDFDRLVWMGAHAPVPHIWVYHEYDDSYAYGEQDIKTFLDKGQGMAYLKKRVEDVMKMPWDELAATLDDSDTLEADYVSIGNANGTKFFILEQSWPGDT